MVLACQALIPLEVERILDREIWDPKGLIALVVMIIVWLGVGYFTNIGADVVGLRSAVQIRRRMFAKITSTPSRFLRSQGRSGVVTRSTTDVDNVSSAVEGSLSEGIPGVARLLVSLVLLFTLEPGVGLVMTIASALFLIIRSRVGRGLLAADSARLEALTTVGQEVDESLTSSRPIMGLHLVPWARHRFDHAVEHLEHKSHQRGVKLVQLVTGANGVGLLGLLAIVVFATLGGSDNMASAAAGLLYVEGVMRGLEALPPWIRSLHLAVASQDRIEEILQAGESDTEAEPSKSALDIARSELVELIGDSPTLVGLVVTPDLDADDVLVALGRGIEHSHLPADTVSINATPAEYLRAVDPDLSDAQISARLREVGLERLAAAANTPIGPSGMHVSANDRQRLGLAVALARKARVIGIGPITCLADSDTASPILARLRSSDIDLAVIATRDPDVASRMDAMLFVTDTDASVGPHKQLLMGNRAYARIWEQRLGADDIDLAELGLGADAERSLRTRLVTEHYSAGDVIYRAGDLADRVVFVISGRVEILLDDATGGQRRAGVLGPGNHCGDLRLAAGDTRAESVIAIEDTVVRSLSVEAISVGMMGMLDRSPGERRIVTSILRDGSGTATDIRGRLTEMDAAEFDYCLAALKRDGAIREVDGIYSVSQRRTSKSGTSSILDKLGDL